MCMEDSHLDTHHENQFDNEVAHDMGDNENGPDFIDEIDESMDGDFDSAMSSAGMGTDEDYNHYEYPEDVDMATFED